MVVSTVAVVNLRAVAVGRKRGWVFPRSGKKFKLKNERFCAAGRQSRCACCHCAKRIGSAHTATGHRSCQSFHSAWCKRFFFPRILASHAFVQKAWPVLKACLCELGALRKKSKTVNRSSSGASPATRSEKPSACRPSANAERSCADVVQIGAAKRAPDEAAAALVVHAGHAKRHYAVQRCALFIYRFFFAALSR